VLDGRVALLRGHATFKAAHIEAGALQAESNEVKEGDKLRKDERLERAVPAAQLLELLDERLKLGR
jgi:hypothetical protein